MDIKRTSKYVTMAAIFLVPIFPVVVISSMVVPYVTGQAFYFRVLVEIAVATWAILAILDTRYRPRFTPLTIVVAVFVAVSFICDLVGIDPLQSLWSNFDRMDGWITISHLFAFYLVIKSMFAVGDTKRLWRRWVNLSLVVALIVAVYGLFQSFGWTAMHFDTIRIDSFLGNPTFLAAYLLFNVFFTVYLFIDTLEQGDCSKALLSTYVVLALLFTYDIFETGTRGTFLGLILGTMLALAVYSVLGSKSRKRLRIMYGCAIALVIIIGVFFWLNRTSSAVQGNSTLKRFASISWTASDQSRQYIWPIGMNGIMERPILGWGQGNFIYSFQKNYNPAMYNVEQWVDMAHNVVIDQLVAFGFAGFLAYLAIFISLLITICKSSIAHRTKCTMIGLLLGYFVHNFFVFDTLASYVFFFTVLALVDSLHGSRDGCAEVRESQKVSVSIDATKYVIAPVIIVTAIFTVYYLNIRPLLSNVYLSKASYSCSKPDNSLDLFKMATFFGNTMSSKYILYEMISCADNVMQNPSASGAVKQSFIDLILQRIVEQIAATPNDAYVYYVSGPFLKRIGKLLEAETSLTKGLSLAPNEQIIAFELASVYMFENKMDQAVAVLKHAYELAPGYAKAASAYAVALVIDGRGDEGMRVLGADTALVSEAKGYASSGRLAEATQVYQRLIAQAESISSLIQKARAQYAAGNVDQAVAILRSIESFYPQARDEIEAAIKEVQP